MRQRRSFLHVLAATAAAAAAPTVRADAPYPTRPIKLLVPFPPGGSSDTIGRTLAQGITAALGQPVVVENMPGGGTTISTSFALRSPADGYTVFLIAPSTAINASLRKNLPFDTFKDIAPVTLAVTVPLVLVAAPSFPASDLQGLFKLAKTRRFNYASSGVGGSPHLGMELLKSDAHIDMSHIPFNGAAPALNAVMGGHVDLLLETVQAAAPLVASGKLKALVVTGNDRSRLLPDVASASEQGFRSFQANSWMMLCASAKTPRPIVEKLNQAAIRLLHQPSTRKTLEDLGFQVVADSSKSATDFLKAEGVLWARSVQLSGATAD